jgi:hypothetical protein
MTMIEFGAELSPPPNGLTFAEGREHDPALVAAADRRARHWQADAAGKLAPGGEAHKLATAAMFRDTFNPYKPTIIDWPKLSDEEQARLTGLPIWDIAVQTEGKARLRMLSYALSLDDPSWHAAIEQNAWEEWRHKTVLSNLVAAYGIALEPEPAYIAPRDTEWAYLVTGFSECIDSFFAFGLFALARRSGFFPEALVDTFEPVIQEEARHILLFANWLAAHRAGLETLARIRFELRVWAVWIFLGWERIGLARGMDDKSKPQDNNFTVSGSSAVSGADVSAPELFALCLEEDARRFAGYDRRLLRPTTTPWIARTIIRLASLFGRKKQGVT